MQKYSDIVLGQRGNFMLPVQNAQVTVLTSPGSVVATIYSDNGVTVTTNPLSTDATGRFSFYAANGRYTLVIVYQTTTITLTDIVLEDDPVNANAAVVVGGTIDATPIGGTTPSTGTFSSLTLAGVNNHGVVLATAPFSTAAPSTSGFALIDNGVGNSPSMQGFVQSGSGSTALPWPTKVGFSIAPEDKGAVGNGSTDDSTAFANCAAIQGSAPIAINWGKTYRISKNTTVGVLYANGGIISVDSGVTFTFDGVIGDPATVIFSGLGTAQCSSYRYSIGWYAGNDINSKWDFARRGFKNSAWKVCHFPLPHATDPACYIQPGSTARMWKLNSQLIIDDPEDNNTLIMDTALIAMSSVTSMIEFSPVNKTENIVFPYGLNLQGNNLAGCCLRIHGGARITVNGLCQLVDVTDKAINGLADIAGIDELFIDDLYVVNFATVGVYLEGTSGTNLLNNNEIRNITSNGGASGCTDLVRVVGIGRDVRFGSIYQRAGTGFFSTATSMLRASSNDNGGCFNLYVNIIRDDLGTEPGLVTEWVGSTTSNFTRFTVDQIDVGSAPTTAASIAYSQNSYLNNISYPTQSITVGTNVSFLSLGSPFNYTQVVGQGTSFKIGDAYFNANSAQALNSVLTLTFPAATQCGIVEVTSRDSTGYYVGVFINSSTLIQIAAGTNTVQTTGVLTGSTGAAGKLNVSLSGGIIYAENRLDNPGNLKIKVH